MGSRGQYLQKGGFKTQEYQAVGEVEGVKVIEKIDKGSSSLPQMSNTPNTMYVLKKDGHY